MESTTVLDRALSLASPRVAPPPLRLTSVLIHGSVVALWFVLFARAFFLHGVVAWSVGIAYVVYDTLLLVFVAWKAWALMRWPSSGSGADRGKAAAGASITPAASASDSASTSTSMHAARRGAKGPTMSVIVAAHNEAAVLTVTLNALLTQQHPPEHIVIADDGSTDGTAALLTAHFGLVDPGTGNVSAPSLSYPALRWLRLPHGGKAKALNAAILTIDTALIMTVDADTLLAPDACTAMRDAFRQTPQLVAAAGLLTPVCAKTPSGRFFQWFQTYEYIRNFISRFAWMQADALLLISGAFACFQREALLAVGGFDPDCLVEDYELIHRLRRYAADHGRDWDVRVIGAARGRTEAPGTLPSFLRQRRRWFAGFLQTQYWYRDMVGNARYGAVGLLMLPIKALDTVQPLYGLTAFVLLLVFLFGGHFTVVLPVLAVIVGKILIDLAFHLWSVHLYRRWSGDTTSSSFGMAVLAALAEPFTFQLLRHSGAALGWTHFLLRRKRWGVQRRAGLDA